MILELIVWQEIKNKTKKIHQNQFNFESRHKYSSFLFVCVCFFTLFFRKLVLFHAKIELFQAPLQFFSKLLICTLICFWFDFTATIFLSCWLASFYRFFRFLSILLLLLLNQCFFLFLLQLFQLICCQLSCWFRLSWRFFLFDCIHNLLLF